MGKNITKNDLVYGVADAIHFPIGKTQAVVETLLNEISRHLISGHTIELRGFGTFMVQPRKGRPARNPRTGDITPIPDRNIPVLRFSPAIRKRMPSL